MMHLMGAGAVLQLRFKALEDRELAVKPLQALGSVLHARPPAPPLPQGTRLRLAAGKGKLRREPERWMASDRDGTGQTHVLNTGGKYFNRTFSSDHWEPALRATHAGNLPRSSRHLLPRETIEEECEGRKVFHGAAGLAFVCVSQW
jgi:hypothetical protein